MHRFTIGAALMAALMAGPVTAQETASDTATPDAAPEADLGQVVATVNGQDITLGEMLMIRSGLPEQYQQLPDTVLWDGILDQLIQQEVLSQTDMAEETERVRIALKNERRALIASEALAKLSEQLWTEEDVQKAYEEAFAGQEMGEEYNAQHILVETEEDALAIKEELDGGADFDTLAKERSTGPSGPQGGQLGWFGQGQMVEPFEKAVMALEAGQVSEPVQTQFGWHVIRLNETRDRQAPPLDQVRDQIVAQLERQGVEEKIKELVDGAEVTRTDTADVDTSVLSRTDLIEN
ncbi:peptidylprolyl isomerase [Litorisediminicola beolgyonensis]|uniref:Parvulin-like PPIase n=1 Tax=Litorisediminicola beolgyonensis TaxID=1173614 RepID=A0ABW3ZD55_9RHOB